MKHAGLKRHKITIQSATESADSYGGTTQTWATYTTCWACIEPLSGREFFSAQQVNAELTSKITVGYDSKTSVVTQKMRITYNGRTFRIVAPPINIEERNREILLMCSELN